MNAAVEARHPPLVLVLHVALGRVAHHDDRHGVRAGHEVHGDVVLARQAAVRAVADERAIHVHGVHALRAADVKHHLSLPPRAGHSELPAVHTRRHLVGQPRRWTGEGHRHVRVVRYVALVLERPVARDVGVAPPGAAARTGDSGCRHTVRVGEAPEAPAAVEARGPRRRQGVAGIVEAVPARERDVHGQPPDGHDLGVGPRPECSDDGKHGGDVSLARSVQLSRELEPDRERVLRTGLQRQRLVRVCDE
ncbi:unannotated protein [freshwater metagenome]|uniref:Unannotated protein n=1 Tax=freshwater metagenome TaxID=449393 RepID=A0A6J7EJ34_9ZZZZ